MSFQTFLTDQWKSCIGGGRGFHGVLQSYQVTPPQKATRKNVMAFRTERSFRENLLFHVSNRKARGEFELMPCDTLTTGLGKTEGRLSLRSVPLSLGGSSGRLPQPQGTPCSLLTPSSKELEEEKQHFCLAHLAHSLGLRMCSTR